MGVGGAARWLVDARSATEVCDALRWADERNTVVYILGGGSNVVVADEGLDGLVIRVDIRGVETTTDGARIVQLAGAGEPWDPFVAETVAADCAGLECLSGIPGSVGGTPVQNVGAYGQDVSGSITRVLAVDRRSQRAVTLSAAECGFGYRSSRFKQRDADRFVVTHVEYALTVGGKPTVAYADVVKYFGDRAGGDPTLSDVRSAILTIRRSKGMVIEDGNPANRSCGSFFVNPVVARPHYDRVRAQSRDVVPHYGIGDDSVKIPAAWLIERAGFAKGTRRGEVGISPLQAQAIVNLGHATAADVVALACEVKRAVWDMFGIALVPEPVFLGFPPSEVSFLRDPAA
jgi:UDP-N-acetylmuramate dehydrogenase